MTLPKKVNFMSHTYTIVDGDSVETRREGSFATIDFLERRIYISHGMQEDAAEEALMHELVHVIEHHLNIPLEEAHVSQLSMGFYHLLKANKLFDNG